MKKLALLFGMSENERRGFLVLSTFIVLIGIVPFLYNIYLQRTTDDVLSLTTLDMQPMAAKTVVATAPQTITREAKPRSILFPFDPNNLPIEKWSALGFSEKQVQVIKNYEAKGGRFRIKADVAKLYVVSDEDFNRLAPYITLPETISVPPKVFSADKATKKTVNNAKEKSSIPMINLTIADTLALKEIRGIGSVLASRIVKFRDALGGFHTVEQVKEVYGISEEQFDAMEHCLILDDSSVQKLPINKLSIEALARHPYVSWKEATHIVRYREQHGPLKSLADLEKMYALNEEFLHKIAPYLTFDP